MSLWSRVFEVGVFSLPLVSVSDKPDASLVFFLLGLLLLVGDFFLFRADSTPWPPRVGRDRAAGDIAGLITTSAGFAHLSSRFLC